MKQLDNPQIIDWALELKHRHEAYAFLMEALRNGRLNLNQTLNGLHALFRIGYHEHGAQILQTFVEMAAHADERVRSEAVQLAIGLVRWASKWEQNPLALSDAQERSVREAMSRGLTTKVANLAREFFETGPQ